jgi:PPOX class probable F420-dependent enzyme
MAKPSERLGRATYRLYPKVVRNDGRLVADTPPTGRIEDMAGRRHCTVVSYRRSGEPVATPVWFGLGEGRLVFRSLAEGVKLKRIARNPDVLIAPCTTRGKPVGPPWRGRARILPDGPESAEAERLIQAGFGAGRRIYKRAIKEAPAVYVEVVPCTDE